MRKLQLIIILFCSYYSYSQWDLGIEVSPSYQLQVIRNKNTGIWSTAGGYGFQMGLVTKKELSNDVYINTGIKYEYTAFDNRVNNFLVSSFRMNSVNIPFSFHKNIIQNIYLNYGGGLNFYFLNNTISNGIRLNANNQVNQIQPYFSLGANILKENFDLGVEGRYHILNLYIKEIQNISSTSDRIASLDLVLKYYF